MKALAGIRILDLTHMLSGPYAAMLLADLGADTIKVEPPGRGEGTRRLLETDPANSLGGFGAYFITLNRNKRSLALDLKSDAGRQVFGDLVREADIVIDNFSVGVTQRLGIDHETLSAINERIITCSVTGFGADGPGAQRPAFDQVAQGYGGGMSITGPDPAHPSRAGIPIGDLGGGMFAVMGILAALQARTVTGRGQHVDISMVDCQVSMLNYMATMYFMSGEVPFPIGNAHFVHVPYDSFTTADGHIIIACIGDGFWPPLVELMDIDALRDPKYLAQPERLKDKARINALINEHLATETSAYWLEQLAAARIPCGPVNDFAAALSDPQVLHRNMVVDLHHPDGSATRAPGNPIKLSETHEDSFSAAPWVGQHSREVLTDIAGYDEARIAALFADGVSEQSTNEDRA